VRGKAAPSTGEGVLRTKTSGRSTPCRDFGLWTINLPLKTSSFSSLAFLHGLLTTSLKKAGKSGEVIAGVGSSLPLALVSPFFTSLSPILIWGISRLPRDEMLPLAEAGAWVEFLGMRFAFQSLGAAGAGLDKTLIR